jgi:hypothetical protein
MRSEYVIINYDFERNAALAIKLIMNFSIKPIFLAYYPLITRKTYVMVLATSRGVHGNV